MARKYTKFEDLPKNKQLQITCEKLWKEIVELRDGKECQVKKHFPEIAIVHSNVYQADHCFTRSNKHLFLDPANGTMVCSSCNMAKHYDNKSVKRAVDYIVQQRVGKKKWKEMLLCDMTMSANLEWCKVGWLEERYTELASIHEELDSRPFVIPGANEKKLLSLFDDIKPL